MFETIQERLDQTTLLVGHNLKFDLMWMLEAGFKYSGKVYDTMLGEYILNKGIRKSLTLQMCCQRRKIGMKDDRIKYYMDEGITFDNIPADLVEEYGRNDVVITKRLFDSQMQDFKLPANKDLIKTAKMMGEFLVVLSDMERNGIYVDLNVLEKVNAEYTAEKSISNTEDKQDIYNKMGDTEINLSSPEQLSWLIYSKKPLDKTNWAKIFNIGVDKATGKSKRRPQLSRNQFRSLVKNNSEPVYKTSASKCLHCDGKGVIKRIKKDGSPYKNYTKCSECDGDDLYITRW